MATGKSFCASAGKKTSTAFLGKGWLPAGVWPTSVDNIKYDDDDNINSK